MSRKKPPPLLCTVAHWVSAGGIGRWCPCALTRDHDGRHRCAHHVSWPA